MAQVKLKRDMYLFHGNITFPADVPMNIVTYKGVEYVEHPEQQGRLTNVKKTDYIHI